MLYEKVTVNLVCVKDTNHISKKNDRKNMSKQKFTHLKYIIKSQNHKITKSQKEIKILYKLMSNGKNL